MNNYFKLFVLTGFFALSSFECLADPREAILGELKTEQELENLALDLKFKHADLYTAIHLNGRVADKEFVAALESFWKKLKQMETIEQIAFLNQEIKELEQERQDQA